MGREVRRVPKDWKHPKKNDKYVPLHDNFKYNYDSWQKQNEMWQKGFKDDFNGRWEPFDKTKCDMTFEEYNGECPKAEDYMPEFPEGTATYYQMYETCSEGTPISPPMKTKEELAHWLEDNGASAFGNQTATYEEWLCTIKRGGCCSFFITSKDGIISGVSACRK